MALTAAPFDARYQEFVARRETPIVVAPAQAGAQFLCGAARKLYRPPAGAREIANVSAILVTPLLF